MAVQGLNAVQSTKGEVGLQAALLEERQPGVLLAVVTLLLGIVSRSYEGYTVLIPRIVRILDRLKNKEVPNDYTYYGIPSPWLQVWPLASA